MKDTDLKEFVKATIIRAIRTAAQVALSMLTIGMTMSEVDWKTLVSVSIVAMVYSILTSIITGLPETKSQGEFLINDDDPNTTLWTLKYNGDPATLKDGDSVRFIVKSKGEEGDSDADMG